MSIYLAMGVPPTADEAISDVDQNTRFSCDAAFIVQMFENFGYPLVN